MTPDLGAPELFEVPLALRAASVSASVALLADRRQARGGILAQGAAALAAADDHDGPRPAGYWLVSGVAVIPVRGVLVQQGWSPFSALWGVTGYDSLRTAFLAALADPEARAVVLEIDSPGGVVAGCFDLVDLIYAERGTKPIWAILVESAYSAAYALASAADLIIVPRTGGTGSVGVICLHAELSRMLDAAGITVSVIRYGDQKAEGNEFEPLTADARARMQTDCDEMGELFVQTVARNRGVKAASVRAMQAGCFLGDAGVQAGLADAVASPDDAFAALLLSLD